MHRLFVGLRPAAPVRQRLLTAMGGVPGARWQDDEQLHVTLRFIGEVARPIAEDVATTLQSVTHPAPAIGIEAVGTFESRGRPHTLWAGITPDDALRTLQQRIERALIAAGLAAEPRRFHPHITLARLGKDAGPVEPFVMAHARLTIAPSPADAFFLFESHLGRAGASYATIARYPLSRGAVRSDGSGSST